MVRPRRRPCRVPVGRVHLLDAPVRRGHRGPVAPDHLALERGGRRGDATRLCPIAHVHCRETRWWRGGPREGRKGSLGREASRVRELLGRADTKIMVDQYRQWLKAQALSDAIEIQADGFAWVKETMTAREPKAFDLVTRGMSNMERIYASASGEGQRPVQVAQVNVSAESAVPEIKALLEELLGTKTGG